MHEDFPHYNQGVPSSMLVLKLWSALNFSTQETKIKKTNKMQVWSTTEEDVYRNLI